MRQGLVRRKQATQGNKVEAPTTSSNLHPGYAPDAALHAIKRHALEFVNPKELQVSVRISLFRSFDFEMLNASELLYSNLFGFRV